MAGAAKATAISDVEDRAGMTQLRKARYRSRHILQERRACGLAKAA